MKHYKLPFKISLEQKYNDLNIKNFIEDWKKSRDNRKTRPTMIHNDLHIELSKFKTFDISLSEIIDLGMRYAVSKQEFRKLAAELIELKENNKKFK